MSSTPLRPVADAGRVIGLGAPDVVRVRLERCQLDPLVEQLRTQRADATERAADASRQRPHDERAIDDCHDELRAIEGMLMQLEAHEVDREGRQTITGPTWLMHDTITGATQRALHRAGAASTTADGPADTLAARAAELLPALTCAHAWVATLVAFRHVDLG